MTHIDGVTQNIQLVSKSTLNILGTYFRIPVSSRSFDHLTASRILLDANVNNGTEYPISTRGSTEKESKRTKEPEKQGTKKIEKCRNKKSPRGFEPQLSNTY